MFAIVTTIEEHKISNVINLCKYTLLIYYRIFTYIHILNINVIIKISMKNFCE